MDRAIRDVERQMTVLLRRVQRIHVSTSVGELHLERSAYAILCQLADDGPQRLGALAGTFGLDPSTITRQVQALESGGLAVRRTDESDRRAAILGLTPEGRDVLDRTRAHRLERLTGTLASWTDQERSDFGRLLEKFNDSVDPLIHDEQPPH